jgi:high-affinity iron transporter
LLGSGLIGLREGLETGIVVMILVAFLVKAGRRDALKWVCLGVGTAIAVTIGIFLVIQFSAYTVTGVAAEAIAGVASFGRRDRNDHGAVDAEGRCRHFGRTAPGPER